MEHLDFFKGVFLPYANFFIFFAAAIYFFRKPLSSMVLKRREKFELALKQAQEAKTLAEAKNKELTQRLARLDGEVAEIKRLTAETAQHEAKKIIEEANSLAAHLKDEAQRLAKAEIENARNELKREIVSAIKIGVEEKLRKEFGADAQIKLAQNNIAHLRSIRVDG